MEWKYLKKCMCTYILNWFVSHSLVIGIDPVIYGRKRRINFVGIETRPRI